MKKTLLWSQNEKGVVKKFYPNEKKKIILGLLPNRTWDGIKHQAKKLNIKRIGRPDVRISDLSILLENTPTTYYWVGFLLADGCFTEKYISFAQKERKVVKRFTKYIKGKENSIYKQSNGVHVITSCNKDVVTKLREKFNIKNCKTNSPPNLSIFKDFTDEQFLSFLIGFIDGDGSIVKQSGTRKDCTIKIGLHKNWFSILKYFEDRVYDMLYINSRSDSLTKYQKRKTNFGNSIIAELRFHDCRVVNFLKGFTTSFDLPVVKSKWGRISI